MTKPVCVVLCDWIKEDKRAQFHQQVRKRHTRQLQARLRREQRELQKQQKQAATAIQGDEPISSEDDVGGSSAFRLGIFGGVCQKLNTVDIMPK